MESRAASWSNGLAGKVVLHQGGIERNTFTSPSRRSVLFGSAEAFEREFVGASDCFYPSWHDVLNISWMLVSQENPNGEGFERTSASCLVEDTYIADPDGKGPS